MGKRRIAPVKVSSDAIAIQAAAVSQGVKPSGPVTAEELAVINRFTPAGLPPLTEEEVISVTVLVTDNLLTYDLRKWDIGDMDAIAEGIIGKPGMFNHEIYDVDDTWGKCWDAVHVATPTAPEEVLLKLPQNETQNRAIVASEGYHAVYARFYMPLSDDETYTRIRFGQYDRVSLGSFSYEGLKCAGCTCSAQDIGSEDCPFYPPMPWVGMTPDKNNRVAPYLIRHGFQSAEEVSFVGAGNIPAAGIVQRG